MVDKCNIILNVITSRVIYQTVTSLLSTRYVRMMWSILLKFEFKNCLTSLLNERSLYQKEWESHS